MKKVEQKFTHTPTTRKHAHRCREIVGYEKRYDKEFLRQAMYGVAYPEEVAKEVLKQMGRKDPCEGKDHLWAE